MDGKNRRDFLKKAASLAIGGFALEAALEGCAGASMARYDYKGPTDVLEVDPTQYPELQIDGGAIQLRVEGRPAPIMIVRASAASYTALSPICTHLGCTVGKDGTIFRCPCHGSQYSLDGTVIHGPAQKSLLSYRTELGGGKLKIYVG